MEHKPYRIAERRKQMHMSQEELAAAIGTNQRQISRYENGVNEPSADVLVELADALSTTTDFLLGRSVDPNRPLRGEFDLDDVEKEVIKILRSKSPSEKKRVMEIVKLA